MTPCKVTYFVTYVFSVCQLSVSSPAGPYTASNIQNNSTAPHGLQHRKTAQEPNPWALAPYPMPLKSSRVKVDLFDKVASNINFVPNKKFQYKEPVNLERLGVTVQCSNKRMKSCQSKSTFKKKRIKTAETFICQFCDKVFSDVEIYTNHCQWHNVTGMSHEIPQQQANFIVLKESINTLDSDLVPDTCIISLFEHYKGYLKDIMQVQVNSNQAYENLSYTNGCIYLSGRNLQLLTRLIGKEFSSDSDDNIRKLNLYLKVILPELLVKIVMDMFSLCKKDAMMKMEAISSEMFEVMDL